ncbi:MAG: glycoside hydrolase family 97 N-terminal domain-containing protein, partial [Bacteroidales bacterium]|nr:glycoside hydrolase family 97 N-terminal domain-containing protein [Bacteroidales bacterium]
MKRSFSVLMLALTLLSGLCASCRQVSEVSSPDGRIVVRALLSGEGVPHYAVDVDGAPFIEASPMGLSADGTELASGFRLLSSQVTQCDSLWHQPWGENKEIRDAHRTLLLRLRNADDVRLDIELRVFDDG